MCLLVNWVSKVGNFFGTNKRLEFQYHLDFLKDGNYERLWSTRWWTMCGDIEYMYKDCWSSECCPYVIRTIILEICIFLIQITFN